MRNVWRIAAVLLAASGPALAAQKKVPVYTRNFVSSGRGFVHDNIQSSADAIQKMGAENDAQREVFKKYIQAGGGFAGVHSASGSERNGSHFRSVPGGKFLRQPRFQKFVVRVEGHPATSIRPSTLCWSPIPAKEENSNEFGS
jgi:type 1 glutamine amidotransferase